MAKLVPFPPCSPKAFSMHSAWFALIAVSIKSMVYVNALANDFKRISICSPVSHWTNISCNRQCGSDSQPTELNKKVLKKPQPNKRTLDQALFISPLILQACNMRDYIYTLYSTRTLNLEEQMEQTWPGCFARGTLWRMQTMETCRGCTSSPSPGTSKRLGQRRKRNCSTKALPCCAVAVTARHLFAEPKTSVTHNLMPS